MKIVFISMCAIALVACGGHGSADDGGSGSGSAFVAFAASFAPFRTWTTFHDDLVDGSGNLPPGVAGARDQYINTPPPTGSTEFPLGTIIVEARADGKIFASVKRGGGFNAAGCKSWEYFELTENPVAITWRGIGPPIGDTYGGDPNSCNDCHTKCAANDYICAPTLQLSSF